MANPTASSDAAFAIGIIKNEQDNRNKLSQKDADIF
jgi:hypothetical protein